MYPVCPICGKDYDKHPAISRKDNKTKICPDCGVGEAFINFCNNYQKNQATNYSSDVSTFSRQCIYSIVKSFKYSLLLSALNLLCSLS